MALASNVVGRTAYELLEEVSNAYSYVNSLTGQECKLELDLGKGSFKAVYNNNSFEQFPNFTQLCRFKVKGLLEQTANQTPIAPSQPKCNDGQRADWEAEFFRPGNIGRLFLRCPNPED